MGKEKQDKFMAFNKISEDGLAMENEEKESVNTEEIFHFSEDCCCVTE